MFGSLRIKQQIRLNAALSYAIFWDRPEEVEKLLRHGADPNAVWDRDRPLEIAVRRAGLLLIESLLNAGADVQEPYRWAGHEFRLSHVAKQLHRPSDIVDCLARAERDAEAKYGARPLRSPVNLCSARHPA